MQGFVHFFILRMNAQGENAIIINHNQPYMVDAIGGKL